MVLHRTPFSETHQNNFNLLRLLFATLVLVSHSAELVDGNRSREVVGMIFKDYDYTLGSLAVSGFFLISGYLILQSWNRTPRLPSYLNKRIRRIVPGFWVASLISSFVVGPLGSNASLYFAHFPVKWFLLGILFLSEPFVPPVFVGQPYPGVNGSMWTIKYEFTCYLLVPLLSALGIAKRRMVYLAFSIFVLLLAGWVQRSGFTIRMFRFSGLLPADVQRLTGLGVFFCSGGCFLLFRDRIRFTPLYTTLALIVVLVGLAVPSITLYCLTTAGAYLLFSFAFARIRALQWFNTLPDISYGVYLYGWPIQKLIHWYWPTLSPWTLLLLTLPVCAACGWLSWHLIEKPFTAAKKRNVPVAIPTEVQSAKC